MRSSTAASDRRSAPSRQNVVSGVIFDYGGVLADEGFRKGCYAIAARYRIDEAEFYRAAVQAMYGSGYISGQAPELEFWSRIERRFDISLTDPKFTQEILQRFVLRPEMLQLVRRLRREGYLTAILSDHSDWLDRLEARDHFFHEFDAVFNSYHLGKNKRDPSIFDDVLHELKLAASQAVFTDNDAGNVERARGQGLYAILFVDIDSCINDLEQRLGVGAVSL